MEVFKPSELHYTFNEKLTSRGFLGFFFRALSVFSPGYCSYQECKYAAEQNEERE